MAREISYGILPLRKQGDSWELFLVHHKNGNFWGFPKGHPEKGESTFQTAKRELKEETGLEVKEFIRLEPYSESYTFNRDGLKIEKEVHYYSAFVVGVGKPCATELIEAGWFGLDEVEQKLTYPEAKKIFSRLKENLLC